MTKKLKLVDGDCAIISIIDGSKCYVNSCLDKFKEKIEYKTSIVSAAYRGGKPPFEVTYEHTIHECQCGKQYLSKENHKKNKKNLFGIINAWCDNMNLGKISLENDFEEMTSDSGELYYRLKKKENV